MKFSELYNSLSSFYPEELRCEWDNDGIMCADDLNREVKKVLITLDVTKRAIMYAKNGGFDTIISHHPLVFHAQKSLNPENYVSEKLVFLIKNGIRVASFHTRLDAAEGGVNDTLVKLLGFDKCDRDKTDPIGRIVTLDKETDLDTFAKNIKNKLGAPFVIYNGNKAVKRIYIVGGDGKDLINNALINNADTLLTGRASYNTTIDAEDMGLNIIEAGHFFTENPVCETLKNKIKEISPDTECEIFYSNEIKFN